MSIHLHICSFGQPYANVMDSRLGRVGNGGLIIKRLKERAHCQVSISGLDMQTTTEKGFPGQCRQSQHNGMWSKCEFQFSLRAWHEHNDAWCFLYDVVRVGSFDYLANKVRKLFDKIRVVRTVRSN